MSRVKVVVNLVDKPAYDVRIGDGLLADLGAHVHEVVPDATYAAVISDSNVAPLYGKQARESLRAAGLSTMEITIPAGEESKSIQVISEVWQALAAKRLDRSCVIVALGGGVVGDLSGFAAATYLRGVSYVQVPTTLLAMVDSSVGGKTGIDLEAGKNLVGAFKQPKYVSADTSVLATLPEREWACGCGEIAKSAVIDSDDFFFWLTDSADALRMRDPQVVREAIARCVVFKAGIVAADEEERAGVREFLNYGHTLGHAIEKIAGFGTYSHGAAVAEGMRFAARLAVEVCETSVDLVRSQDDLLDALGIRALEFSAQPQEIIDAMLSDKKTKDGQIRFVLPQDIGRMVVRTIDQDVLREHLSAWQRSKC